MKPNKNFDNIAKSYLFSEIADRVAAYAAANPGKKLLKLGIGDVTRPLCATVTGAMAQAVAEMGVRETFRGYSPDAGYPFLIDAIAAYYASRGIDIKPDEIVVSDGAKSDIGNFTDLFDADNTVLVPDPVYPVYVDTNAMDGRRVIFADGGRGNGFLPEPDESVGADIIYICSPNNPTGAVYTREGLQKWVDYANERGAVILFDAAYECFIGDDSLPRSIFEIPGARNCAVEFCSLSKTAGFTGVRCGWTVVPSELVREEMSFQKLWLRRQSTKFNGVAYIVQRGAAAVLTPEGLADARGAVSYYKENAAIIASALDAVGVYYTGGKNSPYVWMKCPDGVGSWEFFDTLLHEANVVGTPGAGFGRNGEGYFRLSAFGDRETTSEAARAITRLFR